MATRYIGYSEFYENHCDYSRGLFLKEAHAGVWGPHMETPAGIKVSEAAVIRWKRDLGKTTRALVRERIEAQGSSPLNSERSGGGGRKSRAGSGLAAAQISTP